MLSLTSCHTFYVKNLPFWNKTSFQEDLHCFYFSSVNFNFIVFQLYSSLWAYVSIQGLMCAFFVRYCLRGPDNKRMNKRDL